eukprot:4324367-Alexandrium_andersonii.AAC.1
MCIRDSCHPLQLLNCHSPQGVVLLRDSAVFKELCQQAFGYLADHGTLSNKGPPVGNQPGPPVQEVEAVGRPALDEAHQAI